MRSDPPTVDPITRSMVKLPFDAPDFVTRHVITVTNPNDIVFEAHAQRDRRLRLLIRRYVNQIQYGCKNPACTTPTCLSYRKRQAKTPLRKYTDLSARTIACHLVSEKDPEAALCWNEPVVPYYDEPARRSSWSQQGRRRAPGRASGSGSEEERQLLRQVNGHTVVPPTGSRHEIGSQLNNINRQSPLQHGAPHKADQDLSSMNQMNLASHTERLSAVPNETEQKKDYRSFTQCIFDALPLKMLEWLPVRASRAAGTGTGEDLQPHEKERNSILVPETLPKGDKRGTTQYRAEIGDSETEPVPNYLPRGGDQGFGPSQDFEDQDENLDGNSRRANGVARSQSLTSDDLIGERLNGIMASKPSTDQEKEIPSGRGRNHTSAKSAYVLSPSPGLGRTLGRASTGSHQMPTLSFLSIGTIMWMLSMPGARKASKKKRKNTENEPRSDLSVFIEQSVFYCLKTPNCLLMSISDWQDGYENETTTDGKLKLDAANMLEAFSQLSHLRPYPEILRYMLYSMREAYTPPPWFQALQGSKKKRHDSIFGEARLADSIQLSHTEQTYLSDVQVAYLCVAGLYALVKLVWSPHGPNSTDAAIWRDFNALRNMGWIFPPSLIEHCKQVGSALGTPEGVRKVLQMIDGFDDWDANRLLECIMDVVSTRLAFSEIFKTCKVAMDSSKALKQKRPTVSELIVAQLKLPHDPDIPASSRRDAVTLVTMEWFRALLLSRWNGSAVVRRAGPVGGALLLLTTMYQNHIELGLKPEDFQMRFIADKLDAMEMPVEWLSFRPDNKHLHLLSFPFLFEPSKLVMYFRAVNFEAMSKSFEKAQLISRELRHFGEGDPIPVYGMAGVINALKPYTTVCFVMTIRRDNVLTDALNQVWRRQRQELTRPLKVRMGMDEGEQGIDHGGVQQEFFRVLFGQAFDPAYGMFVIDERTRMTWFQPGSLEPLYKFELLGILMSVAVYNFITLPITFPLAFYRKLLGLKVKTLAHISDGWPDLTRGLQELLSWSEGDVGDVFVRTYEFSYQIHGTHVDIDMEKIGRDSLWPPVERRKGKEKAKTTSFEFPEITHSVGVGMALDSESPGDSEADAKDTSTLVSGTTGFGESEAAMVTNANREQFVKDYIFWLTDKSVRSQYDAFAKGFYTCLDRTALSIFSAEALKSMIEGYQEIDVDGLIEVTSYEDGYEADSPTIVDFWQVVRNFSPEQHRHLLEFVTASDRVPVNGIGSVTFIVQRNGQGDERLPTSMTCFGRLLLPEYSSRDILEEKLTKAIENSKGFGVA